IAKFVIAHEVCHFVQQLRGFLPPPDQNVGLFVTDLDKYDSLAHEREANAVASLMAPGILTPTISGDDMIEYLRRDSTLRGTGFGKR
ncbi:MAG: hypothetical protein AABZ02_07445, partial [Bacteroidota bacterium]